MWNIDMILKVRFSEDSLIEKRIMQLTFLRFLFYLYISNLHK